MQQYGISYVEIYSGNMKQSRNTIARKEITRLIHESGVALSHSELQTLLDGLCDRVTTYRVLERLMDEGIIHRVVDIDGTLKYAECHRCTTEIHHHDHLHFSCEQCKTVTCVEDVEPRITLPASYKVHKINLTVSGICPNCL